VAGATGITQFVRSHTRSPANGDATHLTRCSRGERWYHCPLGHTSLVCQDPVGGRWRNIMELRCRCRLHCRCDAHSSGHRAHHIRTQHKLCSLSDIQHYFTINKLRHVKSYFWSYLNNHPRDLVISPFYLLLRAIIPTRKYNANPGSDIEFTY
jgi:hypothetical protein